MMKQKTALLFLFFLLCANHTFAQLEASNWYFGFNAGINFNQSNGTIEPKTDGALNTFEGCSSISSDTGELLFYTDGLTIYTKNHTVMPNGTNLFGNPSSTQSAIIVPKPMDDDIYYVFTVDTNGEFVVSNGFNYSEVDMSLNGGLGEVTVKNQNLLRFSSEKISAVLKDCEDGSVWVVTFANENPNVNGIYDTFYAFEVGPSGINTPAVKSTFSSLVIDDPRGSLKISPNGESLAIANFTNGLHLFDFNSSTGKVSNLRNLTVGINGLFPYGIEFSPNSQLLYVNSSTFVVNSSGTNTGQLTQFNLSSSDVQLSRVIIDFRENLFRGGLQLGPDGRIYRALTESFTVGLPYLGVIENPNALGTASNYVHRGVELGSRNSAQGLPPFIQSFFNTQIDIIGNGKGLNNLNLCEGETFTLEADPMPGATYTWLKDGATLAETSNQLTIDSSGHYELFIDPVSDECLIEGQAFVFFNPLPTANNATLIQCDDDTDNTTLFNLNEADAKITTVSEDIAVSYHLNNSDALSNINPVSKSSYTNTSSPQTLYARIENTETDCLNYAELELEVKSTTLSNTEISTCDDDGIEDGFHQFDLQSYSDELTAGISEPVTLQFYSNYNDALLEVNELPSSYTNQTAFNETLFVRLENDASCFSINTVSLNVLALPKIETEANRFICTNRSPNTITLSSGVADSEQSNFTYQWSTGATTESIQVNDSGMYQVDIINANGCSKTRMVTVSGSSSATIENIEVTDGFSDYSITVNVTGLGEYIYGLSSQSGIDILTQDSPFFDNIPAGLYTATVTDIKGNCGTVSQLVSVIGFPNFFTPNDDGFNDTWQVYGIDTPFYDNAIIYIFDRYGKLLKQLSPRGNGWDGRYQNVLLPADDYWFSLTLEDGREFRSHFTLRR